MSNSSIRDGRYRYEYSLRYCPSHLYHYTRKVGRMQLFYAMNGTLHPRLNMQTWTISNTLTCALSQFYDWSIRRNVSMIDSWDSCYHCLLVGEGVRRHLSLVASTAPLGVGVTGRLVSGYSLPPPTLLTLFRILDHMAAGDLARGRPAVSLTAACCLVVVLWLDLVVSGWLANTSGF